MSGLIKNENILIYFRDIYQVWFNLVQGHNIIDLLTDFNPSGVILCQEVRELSSLWIYVNTFCVVSKKKKIRTQ